MPSDAKNETKLTPQQELFCNEYLKDLNGTKAAIRAGYSAKTARAQASRMLTIVNIQERCNALMIERATRVQVDAQTVLSELLKLALSDIGEVFDDSNTLLELKEMPENVRRAISSIEVLEEFEGYGENRTWTGYTKKIKFWDKPKALELLGRHLKLFTDKVEVSGPNGGPQVILTMPSNGREAPIPEKPDDES